MPRPSHFNLHFTRESVACPRCQDSFFFFFFFFMGEKYFNFKAADIRFPDYGSKDLCPILKTSMLFF